MKRMTKVIKENFMYCFLVIQPILDIIAYFQQGRAISFAGNCRLLFTLIIPLYTLVKTPKKKKFLGIMGIIALFSCLHIMNGFRVGYISFFQDVKYLLLVLHMPVLAISFIFWDDKKMEKQIPKAFITNFFVITCVVLVSYVTQTGNSTYLDYNFGWTGWFAIPNAQSIILVTLIPFTLYIVLSYFTVWKILIINSIIIFMLIFNGTKTAYYSIFLISFGYIVFFIFDYLLKGKKKKNFIFITIFCLSIILGRIFYDVSPRASMDNTYEVAREAEQKELNQEKKESNIIEEKKSIKGIEQTENIYQEYLNEYLVKKFGYDRVIQEYGENPTAVDFSDVRLMKKIYAKLIWEECDGLTKLVGFQYPEMQYQGENFDLENDPPAILYYYGYLGAFLYVAFLGWIFIRIIKKIIQDFYKSTDLFNFSLLCTLLLEIAFAFTSGYLLRRPNVSVYMAAVIVLCFQRTKKDEEKDNVIFDNYSSI